VLALPAALFAVGVGLAFALAARRDYGAGLLPDRPGRPFASGLLRGPFSLAWRLQWGTLAAWAAGYAILFVVCGAAGKGIGQLVGSSSALQKEFTRLGGQAAIVNAYLASLMLLAGLIAAGYAVSTALRLHAEETEGRADPVLAGAVGRVRWGLSHVVVAVVGTAVLLAIAGVATGLGYGMRAGGTGEWMARMLGAGLAELPAALVIAGVAIAVFGLLPQLSAAAGWTAVGLAVALNIFGQVIQLSHWVLDISPFTHVPRLPGGTVSASPLLWLSVIAVVLGATGLAALRRRDIGSALSRFLSHPRGGGPREHPSSALRERYVETRKGLIRQ
jgi:ABC-2 type transport system permease protein